MSLSTFFKKAGVSALALTTLGAVVKHELESFFAPDQDQELLSAFEKSAAKMRTDPRGGFDFQIGETRFHVDKGRKADYDKLLPFIPITGSSIKFKQWPVSQEVLNANTEVSFKFGIPLSLMMKIQGVESGLDTNNVNKDTKACGLGQFVPSTLYEKTYKYAVSMGFDGLKDTVLRYDPKAGTDEAKAAGYKPVFAYKPVDKDSESLLGIFCTDARYNAHLKGQYLASNIAFLQTQLSDLAPEGRVYPLTAAQAYTAHFAGENRAARMIRDANDPAKAALPALKYFSAKEVKQNAPYFYTQNHKIRSLENFFENLAEKKGLGNDILPDMRGWKLPGGDITIKNADVLVSGLTLSLDRKQNMSINVRPETAEAKFTPVVKASVPIPKPRPTTVSPG